VVECSLKALITGTHGPRQDSLKAPSAMQRYLFLLEL